MALPSDREYDSFDLLPLLKLDRAADGTEAAAAPRREAFFYYAGTTLMAVRVGAFKVRIQPSIHSNHAAGGYVY